MATLTDYIPGITSGSQPVNPTPSSASVWAGFAQNLGSAFDTLTNREQLLNQREDRKWAREEREHARESWAKQDRTNVALDEAAVAAFDVQRGAAQDHSFKAPVAFDGELEGVALDMRRVNIAQQQGRLPDGSVQIKLEDRYQELITKYPDQASEIAQFFNSQGYDSLMFREQKAVMASADRKYKTRDELEKAEAHLAVQFGVYNPAASMADNAAAGRNAQQKKVNSEMAYKQAEDARAANKDAQDTYKWNLQMDEATFTKDIFGPVAIGIDSDRDRIANEIIAAGPNPAKQARIAQMLPAVQANLLTLKSKMIQRATDAGLGGSAVIKQIEERFDGVQKGYELMLQGPLSQYEGFNRSSKMLQQKFGIEFNEALPIFSKISNQIGPAATIELMGGLEGANPALTNQLRAEFKGFQGTDADLGKVHLNNIVGLLKGDLKLGDMTTEEARKQMPSLVKTVRGLATEAVAHPETFSTQDKGSFLNGSSALLNAVVELQPGTATTTDLKTATNALFTDTGRRALETTLDDPNTAGQAQGVMFGARGASAQLLETGKVTGPINNTTGQKEWMGNPIAFSSTVKPWQYVYWDKGRGRWDIRNDKALFDKFVKENVAKTTTTQSTWGGEYPDAPMPATLPWNKAMTADPAVKDKMNVLNNNLDFLVNTAKYDGSLPKGLNEKQLRDYYGRGVAPKAPDGATVKFDSDKEFFDMIDKTEADILGKTYDAQNNPAYKGPTEAKMLYQPIAIEKAKKYGIPDKTLIALVDQETGGSWNPGIQSESNKSDAVGLSQAIKETAARYGLTDRTDPEASLDFASHYLSDLQKKNKGNWLKTFEDYGVLHPSNWDKPDRDGNTGRDHSGYQQLKAKLLATVQ